MPAIPTNIITPDLIAQAKAGDADAITAIYERYATPITRFIFQRVGDRSLAEDLSQDVFVRMLASLPTYEDRGYPIGAWLYRMATCRVIDWRRVHQHRQHEPLEQIERFTREGELDTVFLAVARADEQRALRAALTTLSARHASVLRLRFLAGLPIAAVAQRLALTQQAVKALQHRALAQLRVRLDQQRRYHAAAA